MTVEPSGSTLVGGLMDDEGRHVGRAVLLIDAARRFNLAHLGAGRHVDLEEVLDEIVFLARGIEQVDPDRARSDGSCVPWGTRRWPVVS